MKLVNFVFFLLLVVLILTILYAWLLHHESSKIQDNIDATNHETKSSVKYKNLSLLHGNFHSKFASALTLPHHSLTTSSHSKRIVLCVVCCGDRTNETATMIKSAIVLSQHFINVEIFTEKQHFNYFKNWVSSLPQKLRERVEINLHEAKYPEGVNEKTWRNLFRKCASIRLFLPSLLSHLDSLLYVDTDVLFMSPIEKIWQHFDRMNSSQMVALAPEHEDPSNGWYNRFAKHVFYGKLGVNSGVMLMNLTRLRSFSWEEYLSPIEKAFRSKLTWGDQDIINIIFHYHPDKLYLMGCEYNFRPDLCMYTNACKTATQRGVFALHGSRGVFHNDKQPIFKAIYDAWNKFDLTDDVERHFYLYLENYLKENQEKDNCAKLNHLFLKNIRQI